MINKATDFAVRGIPPFLPGNSPLELKADPGLPGQILKHVDDWTLRKAERRDDCWKYLLSVRGISNGCKDLFRAAESVEHAMKRLIEMGGHLATLNASTLDKAQRATGREKIRLAEKGVRALDRFDGYCEGNRLLNADEVQAMAAIRAKSKRAIKKVTLPTCEGMAEDFPVEMVMVYGWLRWGAGEPGLAFFSGEAMADMMTLILGRGDGLGTKGPYYKKIRQLLRLVPVDYRRPVIVKARRKGFITTDGGKQAPLIEIESRDGTTWSLGGKLA